jgi:hypothetical protein
MRHRDLEFISREVLTEGLAHTSPEHFVIWTGRELNGRAGSLRSRALKCIHEIGSPVPLRILLRRAAAIEGTNGFNPTLVRDGVRLHQSAKPAVYLLAARRNSGEFEAVVDIPFAGDLHTRVAAGTVIIDREGVFRLATVGAPA